MRITAYPPTAPAPKPGAKTRVGRVITPSRTASWTAIGMLAADTLPILSTLKYSWSADSPALPARLRIIVLLAWCGTISSMLSSNVRPGSSGSDWAPSSSSIWAR